MKADNLDIESLVQNYVLGRMTDTEINEFEEYFLSKPEIIEMLEIAQTICMSEAVPDVNLNTDALGQVNERALSQAYLTDDSARTPTTGDVSLLERIKHWIAIPVPAGALAACFIFSIALSFLPSEKAVGPENMLIASFSTQLTRSSASNATIDLRNPNGDSALFIKLKRVDYANYRLKILDDATKKEEWVSKLFSVSSLRDKFIALPKHAAIGNARVLVYGVSESGEEFNVSFCHYSEVCN